MASDTRWLTEKQQSLVWKLTCWLWVALIVVLELVDLIGYIFSKISAPENLVWFIYNRLIVLCSAAFLSGVFFVVVTVGLALVMAFRRQLPVGSELTVRRK